MKTSTDFLVIGSGLAGLAYALKVADSGTVLILSKGKLSETNTNMAQGGIASVTAREDSFDSHVSDTLRAGAGLCREDVVRLVVEHAPVRIRELMDWGVRFDVVPTDSQTELDLTKEGGHSHRRILHVEDHTGRDIQTALLKKALAHPNISFLENHMVVDLITNKKVRPNEVAATKTIGCYALNEETGKVTSVLAKITALATGGAGKTYLYTSNWEGATGDGIALAWRAGARVGNLEFMQFHPTCLYHPQARNFLITEAIRGEGGELVNKEGEAFMKRYHELGSLAPRDIVARSIDQEMKSSGSECVYLDITGKNPDFVKKRFPHIYEGCLKYGIDITQQPIPVVPAAHYTCGGVLIDKQGRTDINNLFAIGETTLSGLHGANRLASNSLLECLAFAHEAAETSKQFLSEIEEIDYEIPDWVYFGKDDSDEMVVISHMWDEIRRLMWNYMGIVRSDRRLDRALHRLQNIRSEIKEYYWNFAIHPDIIELRNLALVAHLSVTCALRRKESRGIHYNLDYPDLLSEARDTILMPSFEL